MRKASQKLKMHISNASVINDKPERFVLHGILSVFAVLAILYLLFLGSMVVNIVERKSLENEARVLANEVNELELAYLSISNDFDLSVSGTLGFQEIKPSFATRKSIGFRSADKVLGLNSKVDKAVKNNEI